jgi:hypothetical protein
MVNPLYPTIYGVFKVNYVRIDWCDMLLYIRPGKHILKFLVVYKLY